MSTTARTLAVAGFIIVSTLPAAAQTSQPPTDEHVKALIAQAMQQTAQQPPATAGAACRSRRPVRRVNLTEAGSRGAGQREEPDAHLRTHHAADLGLHDGGDSRELPMNADLGGLQPVAGSRDNRRVLGRQPSAHGYAELVGGSRAEHVARRGQSTRSTGPIIESIAILGAAPSTPASPAVCRGASPNRCCATSRSTRPARRS